MQGARPTAGTAKSKGRVEMAPTAATRTSILEAHPRQVLHLPRPTARGYHRAPAIPVATRTGPGPPPGAATRNDRVPDRAVPSRRERPRQQRPAPRKLHRSDADRTARL